MISKFWSDESGATAIEYGLIAAGIALAIITVVNNLGTTLNDKFGSVSSSLKYFLPPISQRGLLFFIDDFFDDRPLGEMPPAGEVVLGEADAIAAACAHSLSACDPAVIHRLIPGLSSPFSTA